MWIVDLFRELNQNTSFGVVPALQKIRSEIKNRMPQLHDGLPSIAELHVNYYKVATHSRTQGIKRTEEKRA